MNKKAVTALIIVLVLGGIAVAMIFTGGIYAFRSIACYVGINLSAFRVESAFGPHAGELGGSRILMDVTHEYSNYSLCVQDCYWNQTDCATGCDVACTSGVIKDQTCIDNCLDGCPSCIAKCDTDYYDTSLNYTAWHVHLTYHGVSASNVTVTALEKDANGIDNPITSFSTPSPLSYGNTYNKSFVTARTEDCVGDVTFLAQAATTGIISATWPKEGYLQVDFCSGAPKRDVNVTITGTRMNYPATNQILVDASITGSDVAELCPNATITGKINTINGDGQAVLCSFILDSRRTGWPDDHWKKRLEISITNDVGVDVTAEAANLTIDFSPDNLTSCEEIMVYDKLTNTEVSRYVVEYNKSICHVYMPVTITSGNTANFYIYYDNSDSTLWKSQWTDYISNPDTYNPHYYITDFLTNKFSSERADVTATDVKITKGACSG